MVRKSQALAFTLVEMLIAAGLALLVLVLMVQVLVPAFKISARTSVRSELHQRANHALGFLSRDLQHTSPDGIAYFRTGPQRFLLSMHPIVDSSPEGKRVYQDGLIVYLWENDRFSRNRYVDPDPNFSQSVKRVKQIELENYLVLAQEKKILATGMTAFNFDDASPLENRTEQPISIDFILHRDLNGDDFEEFKLARKLTMFNS